MSVSCCSLFSGVILESLTMADRFDSDMVKREDRSFLSICGNNDFIVIAIEIEQVAITKIAI